MVKKLLSIIVFLAFSATAFSQTDSIRKKEWIVKWNPVAAVDVLAFPTIQFAVEKKLSNYLSVQAELGVQAYRNPSGYSNSDSLIVKNSGFKSNVEVRFFPFYCFNRFKKKKYQIHPFIGIHVFYRHNKYNKSDEYILLDDNSIVSEMSDHFGVSKKAYGNGVVVGFQRHFWKHYMFETYVQIGQIDRDIKNTGRNPNIPEGYENDNYGHYFGKDHEEDSGTNENFSVGFRLGYRF